MKINTWQNYNLIIIFILLIIPLATAQLGFCDEDDECQDIKCENFVWVENYFKESLGHNSSRETINTINILKNTNYNLQDDLNQCETKLKDKQDFTYAAYLLFIACAILIIFIIITRREKKVKI